MVHLYWLGVRGEGLDDEVSASSIQHPVRVRCPCCPVHRHRHLGQRGPQHATAGPDLDQAVLTSWDDVNFVYTV